MPVRPYQAVVSDIRQKCEINDETECFEWQGQLTEKGYGAVRCLGKMRSVHRLVWEFLHGVIPTGMCVLHKCDNRKCASPAHLFLGSNADNIADKVAKDRAGKKLTAESALEVIRMVRRGVTQAEVARIFGIRQTTVSRLNDGTRRSYLQGRV